MDAREPDAVTETTVDGANDAVTCVECGRTEHGPPMGWSSSVDAAGQHWLCPECTRANVRAIESKLDRNWW
jgi:hypothetical protein